MRFVQVGRNSDGRSSVVEVREIKASKAGFGPAVDFLWSTKEFPLEVPVLRRRPDEQTLGGTPDRTSLWVIATYGPNEALGMHCTDTIEYATLLSGSIAIHLEDGDFMLRAGDTVMMPGLLHGWTAGPDGCTINAISIPSG
jgi:hypothetical protein